MQHDLLLLLDLQHFVLSLSPVVPRQPSFIFSSISLNFLEHALFDPRFKHSPSFLFVPLRPVDRTLVSPLVLFLIIPPIFVDIIKKFNMN